MGYVPPSSLPLTKAEFYRKCKERQTKIACRECDTCHDRFKKCDFRFACATTRMNEIPAALVGVSTIKYQGFQMCIKSGSGEECVGNTCPLYEKCMEV